MVLVLVLLYFVVRMPAILTAPIATTNLTVQQSDSDEFWIVADLLDIEWKPECLITTYCNNPELKMIKTNLMIREKSSFSWPLDENFERLSERAFISHWIDGSPQTIEVSLEIIGIDPLYKFQRNCDQSPAVKAFPFEEKHSGSSNPENVEDYDSMIVKLQGHCYNATISFKKYIKNCPWCAVVDSITVLNAYPQYNEITDVKWRNLTFLGFFGALWIITAFIPMIAFWLFQRYRKLQKQKKKKPITAIEPIVRPMSWEILKFHENDHINFVMTRQSSDNSNVASVKTTAISTDSNTDTGSDGVVPQSGGSSHSSAVNDSVSLESNTDSSGYTYVIDN